MARAEHKTLWVIDPSVSTPEDQGVGEILLDWPGQSRLFRPVLSPGDGPSPGAGYDFDGLVVMGSAASVHDSERWIVELSDWLDPVLRGEPRKPVLGVCFGHQLIAHLAGGEIGYLDEERSKKVGIETSAVDDCRLLAGTHRLRVVVSHREEVKQPPPRYNIVATRPDVAIDGIEHAELPVCSFQFHPEARDEFARRAGMAPSDIDDRVREDSRRLLGAFRDQVRSQ